MNIEELRRKRFFRNVAVGFIALGIVALLLNIAPGYKRDKFIDQTNLVINENNLTEELIHKVYVSETNTVYLSKEDIAKFFDNTVHYDEKYNQIVTTGDTLVGTITLGQNKMKLNDKTIDIKEPVIWREDILYIPISEMQEMYNIEVGYIRENNIVIIDELDKGMIVADISETTDLRFRPRGLSKKVSEVNLGERVSCFYTTSQGWRQIRRDNGETRIYKSK